MRIFQTIIAVLLLSKCGHGFLVRRDLNGPSLFQVGDTALRMSTEFPSRQKVAEGMELFRRGDIQGSIEKFDSSVPPDSKAYLWQRGLSYYYADEFEKGSQQFRDDVLRSPLDVEEIVWDIACLLRMDPTFPPPMMMSLPPGKTDRRPIMVNEKMVINRRVMSILYDVVLIIISFEPLVGDSIFLVSGRSIGAGFS